MINEVKKEITFLKILIVILVIILILFWWSAFFFNQYISDIYNKQIKKELIIWNQYQSKINIKVKKISDLLKWKDLAKIKGMQSLYNIYFKTRYQTLPKELILEILEEILPPNAKIWDDIRISNKANVALTLYTTNLQGLDVLYNKFKYYSDVLKLLSIKWFNTITLNKNNIAIRSIVQSNSKYVYKTTIQLQLNNENLIKYYSLLYHPTKNYEVLKSIYWPDLIEPSKIPSNITINDSIKLHELYEKKYNISKEQK